MYKVGQIRDSVHRTYKEHNRWMYVAPVREKISLWDVLIGILIGLSLLEIMTAVIFVMVMYLI